jgi:hypothetical protein
MKRAAGGNLPIIAVAKKTKVSPEAAKCAQIEKALQEADIPTTALEALLGVLRHSLLVAKEERHEFQEEVVGMAAGVLERIRGDKERSIPDAQAKLEECKLALMKQERGWQHAQDEHEIKTKECDNSKRVLADVAGKFQTAKAALEDARRRQTEGDKSRLEVAGKKEAVEDLLKEIPGLCERAEQIPAFLEKLKLRLELVDTSMLSATSLALEKAPESRGEFDVKVIKELEEKCTSHITALTETLTHDEIAKASRDAHVAAAEAALREACGEQLASARAFTKASEAAAAAGEAGKEGKKAAAQWKRSVKEASVAISSAEAELEFFATGPEADFRELRDRLPAGAPASPELEKEEEAMELNAATLGMGEMHESVARTEVLQAVAVVC